MALEAILNEVDLPHREGAACDAGEATPVCAGAAVRKFRIVKREKNIPVLGVCVCCHAEFAADPETIGRPRDAHAHIQKQFVAHKCQRLDAGRNPPRG
jgi:hypothetical protein